MCWEKGLVDSDCCVHALMMPHTHTSAFATHAPHCSVAAKVCCCCTLCMLCAAPQLFDALRSNNSITSVNLSANHIGDEGVQVGGVHQIKGFARRVCAGGWQQLCSYCAVPPALCSSCAILYLSRCASFPRILPYSLSRIGAG